MSPGQNVTFQKGYPDKMSQVKMSRGQNVTDQNVRGKIFSHSFLIFQILKNDQNIKFIPLKDDNEILMKIIRRVEEDIFVGSNFQRNFFPKRSFKASAHSTYNDDLLFYDDSFSESLIPKIFLFDESLILFP